MNNKFIFFDIKRNWFVTILITMEVALWIFYTASLVSLINFDNSYRSRYNRSISVNNSEVMKFYKMVSKDDYYENKDVYDSYIKESLKVVSNNNYTYGFVQRDNYEEIPIESFGLNLNNIQSNFTTMDKFNSPSNPVGFNYGMIENYKKNIIGEISKEEWVRSDNCIPMIVGSEIAKKLKKGDTYEVNNIKYKILGELKKDTLAYDYTNTVDSSFLLNTSFVIPLSEDKYFENFNFEPITIFFNGDMETAASKVNDEIECVSKDIVISNSSEDLDKFLDELRSKKYYEICRILIVSIIASASIITTIDYKINKDRDRIGILYSFGTTKKNIFKIFSREFLINIFIGIVGGSIFYLKKCASVYVFFINEDIYLNLVFSLGILLLLILSIMLLGFKQVNKLTPKEMIGGFIE